MNPNLRAFLEMIAWCEVGTADAVGYQALYGFHPIKNPGKIFESFADHPRQAFKTPWGWTSSAGRYQAMCKVPGKVKTDTWGDFIRKVGVRNFSPDSQDEFGAWCVQRRGATVYLNNGLIVEAILLCNREWASLPGSPYGQPIRSMEWCLRKYKDVGGSREPATDEIEYLYEAKLHKEGDGQD